MSSRKNSILFLFIIWFVMQPSLIAAAMVPAPVPPIQAPGQEIDWSMPVNLSQSGAASNPHLFSSTDGKLQALWWDRFDGMVLSQYEAGVWSVPIYQSIRSEQLTAVPHTLSDAAGGLHAFWIETIQVEKMGKRETLTALKYSVRAVEAAAWSEPVILAESAGSFAVFLSPSGDFMLAYIRVKQTPEVPAGMYYIHKKSGSTTWDLPRAVDPNIYYRLTADTEIFIQVAGIDQTAFIAWNDREGRSVFAASYDSGESWEISSPFEISESYSTRTRLILSEEGQELMAIWEDSRASTCNLYQQSLNLQLNGEPVVQPVWSAAEPVGLSVAACPRGDWFSFSQDHLVWVLGEGTSQLTIAARDRQTGEWSLPQNFSFNFTTDLGQSISMGELSAVMYNDELVVIGSDAGSGEIWMTSARLDPLTLAHPAVSPWSDDLIITAEQQTVGMPSIAMDKDGRCHMVYLVGSQQGLVFNSGSSMFYSRSDHSSSTPPVQVSSIEGDIYRNPSIIYSPSNDELHLVWSGGHQGEIMYTRANASEAASLGWLSPVILSAQGGEAMPQILVDSFGKLHVLYIITLNEARGVYITSSEDGGKSWSEPSIVFDAAAAQWQMVDHPTFGSAPDGTLYAAWVDTALPGLGSAKGIYSSISKDSGITWEKPVLLAGAGFDQPQIAITSTSIHVLMKNIATGGLFYRWGNLEEITPTGEGWSTSASAPGSANQDGSFEVLATSTNIFLAAADLDSNVIYSTWGQNDSSVGWTSQERVFPDSVVRQANAGTSILPDFQASAYGPAGMLGLVFARETISQDSEGQDVYASSLVLKFRSIPVAEEYEVMVEETPAPLPQTLEEMQPTIPAIVPTATPDLNVVSGQNEEPFSPLVYGGGFAALLIGGVFVVYVVIIRNRPRG